MRRSLCFELILLLTVFQTGCVQLAIVDSTRDPLYAPMIGRTYELTQKFVVRGIQLIGQKSPDPAYILVMPPPGIGGHLVTDLGLLAAGSRFQIVGVVTHRSELFPSTEYVIALESPELIRSGGAPIRINNVYAWKLYEKPAAPDQPPGLSETYFRPIPASR
jgi:hypothetical protein